MRSVRKIFAALEARDKGPSASTLGPRPGCPSVPSCCVFHPGGAAAATIQLESVTTADFLEVISHTKPSCRNLMDKYALWASQYQAAASS